MSSELVSLHMMVVAAAQPDQELWRQAAVMASLPIHFAAPKPMDAVELLTKGEVDVCVLDSGLPESERTKLIAAARARKLAPLLFVSAPRGAARVTQVDGMLGKPVTAEDARKLVEICIRAKHPCRVLIVDDSSTMRSIVRKILSASHFTLQIHDVAEGNAALIQLRSGMFDLVFLDYNMPGLNGFDTLMGIRRKTPKVSVVMMTSTVDNTVAQRAHAAGVLAFLRKPFYPADIDRLLERYYGLNAPLY
jgi:CheY-like chemotaxis protein